MKTGQLVPAAWAKIISYNANLLFVYTAARAVRAVRAVEGSEGETVRHKVNIAAVNNK